MKDPVTLYGYIFDLGDILRMADPEGESYGIPRFPPEDLDYAAWSDYGRGRVSKDPGPLATSLCKDFAWGSTRCRRVPAEFYEMLDWEWCFRNGMSYGTRYLPKYD